MRTSPDWFEVAVEECFRVRDQGRLTTTLVLYAGTGRRDGAEVMESVMARMPEDVQAWWAEPCDHCGG